MSLRRSPLPPNYLFPAGQEDNILPDDLTQLTILLTGSCGTPYTEGLWQLNLRIPTNYPQSPPKAVFKTRIWHPNVDESTGAVCLETLKRDWDPKLTLRDILVVSHCWMSSAQEIYTKTATDHFLSSGSSESRLSPELCCWSSSTRQLRFFCLPGTTHDISTRSHPSYHAASSRRSEKTRGGGRSSELS